MLDRIAKRRPGQFEVDESGRPPDPRDPHCGPLTELIAAEKRERDSAGVERLLERLRSLKLNEVEHEIVILYVADRLTWAQIAEQLERSEVSSRVVMNRLRDRILPQVFEPIRTRLPGDAWVIAEQILVRRVKIDEFCQAVGVGAELVRRTLAERVIPAVFDEYGADSAGMLLRLTGFRH